MNHQQRNSEFYLSPTEVCRLINGAKSARDKVVLSLFAYTGIRRAELRDLKVEDIHFDMNRIIIQRGKGGKQRIIFFPDLLINRLDDYIKIIGRDSLFPGRKGKSLSLRSVNNIVTLAGQHAGIKNPNPRYKNINPHLLRHSLARNWKDAGGSLESLQKILGHASMKTTLDLYGTQSINDTERIYRGMSEKLVG